MDNSKKDEHFKPLQELMECYPEEGDEILYRIYDIEKFCTDFGCSGYNPEFCPGNIKCAIVLSRIRDLEALSKHS